MDFRLLRITTLITLTRIWLQDARLMAELRAHPLGRAYVDELSKAYERLVEQAGQRSVLETEVEELTSLLELLDARHDDLARGIHRVLEGLVYIARTPERAAFFENARRQFFPIGLNVVNLSYADEAGAATQLSRALTPAQRALLDEVRIDDRSLNEVLEEWLGAGERIGEHNQRRAHVDASMRAQGSSGQEVAENLVRKNWTVIVRALFSCLDVIGLSESGRERLFAPLRQYMAQATRQQNPSTSDDEPGETPDETPADGPVDGTVDTDTSATTDTTTDTDADTDDDASGSGQSAGQSALEDAGS